MNKFLSTHLKNRLLVFLAVLLGLILAGCSAGLFPQMTFQGRLTDQNGDPLNGQVSIRFSYFHEQTGGTAIYNENRSITVEDGLFNTVIGPSTAVGGLTPKDLAEPVWVELRVTDGVITETLTPRMRLYGAPYAFTLMPGAVVSASLGTNLTGGVINGILEVDNSYAGSGSDPSLPALRLVGEKSLELTEPVRSVTGYMGSIYSDKRDGLSDIGLYSNDEVDVHLDQDNNGSGLFRVLDGSGTVRCYITEAGNLACSGTKSAVVEVNQEARKLYAIESPEVWFEDFGSARLENGQAEVSIDEIFAATVNLGVDYHVFLTPLGDCQGLYVAEKTPAGFGVRELGGGTASIEFDYRLVAKRAGYETQRLELANPGVYNEEAR